MPPHSTRKKDNNKNIQSVMRPTRRHHPINGSDSIDQHTPQKGVNSHTNQPNKNHWHTIEFSHNTRTLKHTPQTGPVQSSLLNLTHTHTTDKTESHADPRERNHQRSFSYRHLTSNLVRIGLSGGALSVTLTHLKLHTPNQQHKSPG